MTFRIGMKVVCVDAGQRYENVPCRLIENETYEVLGFAHNTNPQNPNIKVHTGYGLLGVECYESSRFRPVVESETDTDTGMAILKSILEDAKNFKVKESENV